MKYILLLGLLGLLLLSSCSSFDDCYNTCIDVNRNTQLNYTDEGCPAENGFVCITKPSKELKKYCYNECKASP